MSTGEVLPALPHTCITCRHLLGNRNSVDSAKEKWRCYHPSNIFANKLDVVTGVSTTQYNNEDIYTLRSGIGGCGVEGKWWEIYEKPSYTQSAPAATVQPATTSSKAERINKLRKTVSVNDI